MQLLSHTHNLYFYNKFILSPPHQHDLQFVYNLQRNKEQTAVISDYDDIFYFYYFIILFTHIYVMMPYLTQLP